jgi:hypothetical protein
MPRQRAVFALVGWTVGIDLDDQLHRDGQLVRLWRSVVVMLLSAGVAGCAYHSLGPIDDHYAQFKARMPERDSVFVCSAYGCRTQTQFRFTSADIATLQLMMSEKKTATPADERKAVAATLAWMERRVGDVVGTSADRPGDDLAGNGDPTQMDCVDIATNLTSYLLILERHQLLRHHRVGSVFAKEDLRRGISGWLHFAAILVENKSKQEYAVDGWLLASGKPPEIVEREKWYIDDSSIVFGSQDSGKGTQPN